eukprot:COSAG01_NODE_607_length_14866_cov_60.568633_13_plen_225_part_00
MQHTCITQCMSDSLVAWQIITGVISPAGRLPITYYDADFVKQRPMQECDVRAHGGITYRHYSGTPLWQFGFGLSYTRFRFEVVGSSVVTVTTEAMHGAHSSYYAQGGGAISSPAIYRVNVTNTGDRASDVVVLGFLRNPAEHGDAPKKELFNFERVHMLRPGVTEQVTLSVPSQVLSLVDEEGTERLLAGEYTLEFGVEGAAEEAVATAKLLLFGRPHVMFSMP